MRDEPKLITKERELRQLILAQSEEAVKAAELVTNFKQMVRERGGTKLDEWLAQAEASTISQFKGLAASIKRDYKAVKAGLS